MAERQPTEWEKRCANHIFEETPVIRTYKQLLKFNNKKTINGQKT